MRQCVCVCEREGEREREREKKREEREGGAAEKVRSDRKRQSVHLTV